MKKLSLFNVDIQNTIGFWQEWQLCRFFCFMWLRQFLLNWIFRHFIWKRMFSTTFPIYFICKLRLDFSDLRRSISKTYSLKLYNQNKHFKSTKKQFKIVFVKGVENFGKETDMYDVVPISVFFSAFRFIVECHPPSSKIYMQDLWFLQNFHQWE